MGQGRSGAGLFRDPDCRACRPLADGLFAAIDTNTYPQGIDKPGA